MKKTRKFISIFAILFALVFALSVCFFAACGNKDDNEKDNDTTTEQDGNTDTKDDDDDDNDDDGQGGGQTSATVSSVALSADVTTLEIDETANLTASVTMSDTSSAYSGSYTWASSDTTVATVASATTTTGSNTVTAVGAGSATITVTVDNNKSDSCSITVNAAAPVITKVEDEDEFKAALEAGGNIELGAAMTGMFTVSADTTIDLAGYSITDATANTEETQYTITVATGASLTITDSSENETGSIVCTYAATGNENARLGAAIYSCGTLNVEGGTLTSSSVGILAENGDVTMNAGEIDTTYYTIWGARGVVTVNVGGTAKITGARGIFMGGDCAYGYDDYATGEVKTTLNVSGDAEITSTFGSAITTLGLADKDTVYINITGGTVSGRGETYTNPSSGATADGGSMPAIYMPNGNLTISGGTISGTTAVEVKGGNTTITGGTITCTCAEGSTKSAVTNTSGSSTYGYSLAVYPYGITSREKAGDTNFDNSTCVKVSGGTFNGAIYDSYINDQVEDDHVLEITGGAFSEDPSNYVAEGYDCSETPNGEGYYEVTSSQESFIVPLAGTADGVLSTSYSVGDTIEDNGLFTLAVTYAKGMKYHCGGSSDSPSYGNLQVSSHYTSFTDINGTTHNPDQGIVMSDDIAASSQEDSVISITAKSNIEVSVYVTLTNNSFNSDRSGYILYSVDGVAQTSIDRSAKSSSSDPGRREKVTTVTIQLTAGQVLTIGAQNADSSTARLWLFGAEAKAV